MVNVNTSKVWTPAATVSATKAFDTLGFATSKLEEAVPKLKPTEVLKLPGAMVLV